MAANTAEVAEKKPDPKGTTTDGVEKGDSLSPVVKAEVAADAYTAGAATDLSDASKMSTTAKAVLPNFLDVPAAGTLTRENERADARNLRDANDPKDARDSTERVEKPNPYAHLSPEGQDLVRLAESKIKVPGYPNADKEFEQFTRDVTKFERDAKSDGLPDSERTKVYGDIGRLLNSTGENAEGATRDGIRSERQRVRVAEQLMNMVANPNDRNQGTSDNCSPASLEGLLLTGKERLPSKVTGMVTDLSLTGKTQVGDVEVKLDRQSMQSFGEHAENREVGVDKQRLAESIFRMGSVNTYYAMQKRDGDPEGQLQYVSRPEGNRLIYTPDPTGRLEHQKDWKAYNTEAGRVTDPGNASTSEAMSKTLTQMTGKSYADRIVAVAGSDFGDAKWMTILDNQKQVQDHLQKLKDSGRLPAALTVHSNNPELSGEINVFNPLVGKDKQERAFFIDDFTKDGHGLLVTDVQGRGPGARYDIKNTWGEKSNKSFSAEELHNIMSPLSPNRAMTDLKIFSGNHDSDSRKDRNLIIAAAGAAITNIVAGYRDLPENATDEQRRKYTLAGADFKQFMDSQSPKIQREWKTIMSRLERNAKSDDATAMIVGTYHELVK